MYPPSQESGPALLAPGPFGVGFRSTWEFDEARTYRTEFDDGKTYGAEKSPRPVLVLSGIRPTIATETPWPIASTSPSPTATRGFGISPAC